ncbi:MAG: hypothetical protein ACTSWY_06045 [Promethearchaeota archaeon]
MINQNSIQYHPLGENKTNNHIMVLVKNSLRLNKYEENKTLRKNSLYFRKRSIGDIINKISLTNEEKINYNPAISISDYPVQYNSIKDTLLIRKRRSFLN